MKSHLFRLTGLLTVIPFALAGVFSSPTPRASADSPIKILKTSTASTFRESFTFRAKASTTAGKITDARVIYRILGENVNSIFKLKGFTPASEVDLEYVLDTRSVTTPPWHIMFYSSGI